MEKDIVFGSIVWTKRNAVECRKSTIRKFMVNKLNLFLKSYCLPNM